MEILTTWVSRELTTELTTLAGAANLPVSKINDADDMSLAYDNGM